MSFGVFNAAAAAATSLAAFASAAVLTNAAFWAFKSAFSDLRLAYNSACFSGYFTAVAFPDVVAILSAVMVFFMVPARKASQLSYLEVPC